MWLWPNYESGECDRGASIRKMTPRRLSLKRSESQSSVDCFGVSRNDGMVSVRRALISFGVDAL